jgi:predicted component of type VI protein secretion system
MTTSFTVGRPPTGAAGPLRILVIADLQTSRAPSEPAVLREAGDLEGLIGQLAPTLVCDVPNHLSDAPATLECRLEIRSFKDLAPAALLKAIAEVRPASELHHALAEVCAGKRALESISAELQSWSSAPGLGSIARRCQEVLSAGAGDTGVVTSPQGAPSDASPARDESVGRILELVDVPGVEDRAASAIGKVVGAVGGKRGKRDACAPAVQQALDELTARLQAQLRAVRAAELVQRVEAMWRGLELLVRHADFRRGVELQLLHVPQLRVEDEQLEALLEETEADLVLAPYQLASPSPGAQLASWLGRIGEAMQAPVVVSLAPGFFDIDWSAEQGSGSVNELLSRPELTKWNAVREQPHARWVCATYNRFCIARPARERRALPPSEAEEPVLADPCWLVGILAARSFARVGWPTEITGTRSGRLDDLGLREIRSPAGRRARVPVESFLRADAVADLAAGGFAALCAEPDSDSAVLLRAPMVYRGPSPIRPSQPISLPYQLLASRLARVVAAARHELADASSAAEVEQKLQLLAERLIGGTGRGAAVGVAVGDDLREVTLRLRTGADVLGGVPVELSFGLGGGA